MEMKAHSIDWISHKHNRRTRTVISPRPRSENVSYFVDLAAKVFTAGVPAVALIIAIMWAVNLPELHVFTEAVFWIKSIAILAAVPAATWLYVTIYQLKESGWA
jgi:hypothetical protein